MKNASVLSRLLLPVVLLAASQTRTTGQPAPADAPAPAFYYNTLGQPWQTVAPGLLDWENTVGYANTHTLHASDASSSALALTSLVLGLKPWADIAGVVGGTLSGFDDLQKGGFFGSTAHLALDLGSDNGLAVYAAPAWTFDKDGIGSSSFTMTASAGNEPATGWSHDVNVSVNYTDQSSFAAVTSPDLHDLWTGALLASVGRGAADHLTGFSLEGFGAYASGNLALEDGSAADGSAWRLGGGVGYQRNFGKSPMGLNAWALYGGVQWEWADLGADGTASSPSLAVNFSLGSIRPIRPIQAAR